MRSKAYKNGAAAPAAPRWESGFSIALRNIPR